MGFGLNNLVKGYKDGWGSLFYNPIYVAVILTFIIALIVFCLFNKKATQKRMFRFFVYALFANLFVLILHFKLVNKNIEGKYEDKDKINIMSESTNINVGTPPHTVLGTDLQ